MTMTVNPSPKARTKVPIVDALYSTSEGLPHQAQAAPQELRVAIPSMVALRSGKGKPRDRRRKSGRQQKERRTRRGKGTVRAKAKARHETPTRLALGIRRSALLGRSLCLLLLHTSLLPSHCLLYQHFLVSSDPLQRPPKADSQSFRQ